MIKHVALIVVVASALSLLFLLCGLIAPQQVMIFTLLGILTTLLVDWLNPLMLTSDANDPIKKSKSLFHRNS